jgi:hypothetical protein
MGFFGSWGGGGDVDADVIVDEWCGVFLECEKDDDIPRPENGVSKATAHEDNKQHEDGKENKPTSKSQSDEYR